MTDGLFCGVFSVRFIEGTVTSLEEENGCVTGIQYRDKESGNTQVSQRESFGEMGPLKTQY